MRANSSGRNRFAGFGKALWYACATILILSIPTYSYLVPSFRISVEPSEDSSSKDPSPERMSSISGDAYPFGTFPGSFGYRTPYSSRTGSSAEAKKRTVTSNRQSSNQRALRAQPSAQPGSVTETPATDSRADENNLSVSQAETRLSGELSRLEKDFASTSDTLFSQDQYPASGGFYMNPFQAALDQQGGGSAATGDGSSGDGNSGPGDGNGGDSSGGDTSGSGDSGSSDGGNPTDPGGSGQSPPDEEEIVYDLLLINKADLDDEIIVRRAVRDDDVSILTEDGTRVILFSSLVGFSQRFLAFGSDESFASGDFNNDGLDDLLVVGIASLGGTLQGYSSIALADENAQLVGFFPYREILSIAIFDFNLGGLPELGVIFHDSSNLVVFEIGPEGLRYSRELVLPFKPALVVNTRDAGVFGDVYLQVLDASMQRSILFSSRYPGVYSVGKPPTFVSIKSHALDGSESLPLDRDIILIEYADRFVLCERIEGHLSVLGSVSLEHGVPLVLVGDFFGDGSGRLFVWP